MPSSESLWELKHGGTTNAIVELMFSTLDEEKISEKLKRSGLTFPHSKDNKVEHLNLKKNDELSLR